MSLPQVAIALHGWEQKLVLKTVTKTRIDFVDTIKVEGIDYLAVVQPTKRTIQNKDTLDWSKEHITTHSEQPIRRGQFIEYKGQDYKVIDVINASEYGFYKAICEDTMQDVLEITPIEDEEIENEEAEND